MGPAGAVYTDIQSLTALRARAGRDADASLEEVARQFESLFLQQMLKTMRQASLGEGLLESDQSLFYRDIYDQQLAMHLSESGGMGLADMIIQQLGGSEPRQPLPAKSIDDYPRQHFGFGAFLPADSPDESERANSGATQPASEITTNTRPSEAWSTEEFVEQLWPWAREAAELLGLQPQALLAQAALETGWGRHLMKRASGESAHNLFGIKADKRWDGEKVRVNTLEYDQGVAVKRREAFRAYDSFRESFLDYAAFIKKSPRYADALASAPESSAYFEALQRAGYATDPAYARKIQAVLEGPEMERALQQLKGREDQPL